MQAQARRDGRVDDLQHPLRDQLDLQGRAEDSVGSVEVLAYGTALIP